MSDDLSVWGDKNLTVPDVALDKINRRRIVNLVTDTIEDAVSPYTVDDGTEEGLEVWPEWTNETWPKFLHSRLDYMVDRKAIYSYITDNVHVDIHGCPQAEIYLKPVKAVEMIKIECVVTKEGMTFAELLRKD